MSCEDQSNEGNATTTFSVFREHGLAVDWDHSGSNRIAYSMKGTDGYYDIHTANSDGSNDICVTCEFLPLTEKHIGDSGWHPFGKWMLITVEKPVHPGSSFEALPGLGAYTDIYIINRQANKKYRLVESINDNDHGVIIPRFSHDGTKILWTDRKKNANVLIPKQMAGYWTIKVADFAFTSPDSIPRLTNIRTIEPEPDCFYEGYGFSDDDSKIIFCSNMNELSFYDENIYTIDISSSQITQLTTTDYNEHAMYTPNGENIVWMSNMQASSGTDWWMMNLDGSSKHRLTYFNEPGNTQYAGHSVWCGLVSFSPDGKTFVGGRQLSLLTQEGEIVKVQLP
ncbi:MAG: hypothetical protein WKF87_06980 [Chryseolinea sp.]